MILIFSILFYLLGQKWKWFLWLILPLSIFLDLWKAQEFGISGLEILLMTGIIYLILGKGARENSSGRRLRI